MFTLFLIIIVAAFIFYKNKKYKESEYYQITKLSYQFVRKDLGRYGEYLTYKYLKNYENEGVKFLFNIYLPKENEKTTEIDLLMISKKGIFVIESKNFSGWIFGEEYRKDWYQTLPSGRNSHNSHKERFYNPVMQNYVHIKCLKNLIGEQVPTYSIIVFSERCELKRVIIKNPNIKVIHRNEVKRTVDEIWSTISDNLLSDIEVEAIYQKLYPYTQVDERIKKEHIENIQKELSGIVDLSPEHSIVLEKIVMDSQKESFKCPRCGGALVLRTAKHGMNIGNQFYGCSNFPKCRYMRNIDN